jgi:hypothetical protein
MSLNLSWRLMLTNIVFMIRYTECYSHIREYIVRWLLIVPPNRDREWVAGSIHVSGWGGMGGGSHVYCTTMIRVVDFDDFRYYWEIIFLFFYELVTWSSRYKIYQLINRRVNTGGLMLCFEAVAPPTKSMTWCHSEASKVHLPSFCHHT